MLLIFVKNENIFFMFYVWFYYDCKKFRWSWFLLVFREFCFKIMLFSEIWVIIWIVKFCLIFVGFEVVLVDGEVVNMLGILVKDNIGYDMK